MKRRDVLKKLRQAAKAKGLRYEEVELKRHLGVIVGEHRSTIGRHTEIDEITARKFWSQFEDELGKGWWR